MGDLSYAVPRPLQVSDELNEFNCSAPSLEHWLKRRALKNHHDGTSRVFVVTQGNSVVAYYALSAGSVTRDVVPGRVRRNMPEPIPIAILGRLAVDTRHESRGLVSGMLKDAVMRTQRTAQEIGIRALLCHAIDERALAFYLHHGFLLSPIEPLTAILPLT